jgi:outer membrane protein OmpA-like peptidoglycan-associated protein
MDTSPSDLRPTGVVDRSDPPRGLLNTAWPIAALALLLVMLVRACVPAAPVAANAPFDPAAATRQANDAALAALRALSPEMPLAEVLAALNGAVINFAAGSDAVPPDAGELLRAAAAAIAALPPGTRVEIVGHTDNVGNPAANQLLSQRRAASVRAALVALGAPVEAIDAAGVGDRQPVASNDSEAGRFRNRRIEFRAAP